MAVHAPRLRPLGVGDLLDEMMRLYRNHFVLLAGIAAVVLVPLMVAANLWGWLFGRQFSGGGLAWNSGAWGILGALGGVAINLAISYAVSEIYLGRHPSIGSSYAGGLQRFGSAVVLSFLIGLSVVLMAITLIGIPVAVYFGVCWMLSFQTFVLERQGVRSALSRSRALIRGHWWRVLGIAILVGILGWVVGFVISIPALVLGGASVFLPEGFGKAIITVLAALVNIVSDVFVTPIWFCGAVLLYYDLRVRKEGFDLELMARELGTTSESDPTVA